MRTDARYGVEIDGGWLVWTRLQGIQVTDMGTFRTDSAVSSWGKFVEEVDPQDPVTVALVHASTRTVEVTVEHSSGDDEYLRAAILEEAEDRGQVADLKTAATVGIVDVAKVAAARRPVYEGAVATVNRSSVLTAAAAITDKDQIGLEEILEAIADSGIEAEVTLAPLCANRDGFHVALRFAGVEVLHVVDGIVRQSQVYASDVEEILNDRTGQRAPTWAKSVADRVERFVALNQGGIGATYEIDRAPTTVWLYGLGAGIKGLREALEAAGVPAREALPTEHVHLALALPSLPRGVSYSMEGMIATAAAAGALEVPALAYFPNDFILERDEAIVRTHRRRTIGVIAALGIVLAVAAAYLPDHWAQQSHARATAQLSSARAEVASLSPEIAAYKYVETQTRAVKSVLASEPDLTRDVQGIFTLVPSGASIVAVSLLPAAHDLTVSETVLAPSVAALVKWLDAIQNTGVTNLFTTSENVTTGSNIQTTITFDLAESGYPRSSDVVPSGTSRTSSTAVPARTSKATVSPTTRSTGPTSPGAAQTVIKALDEPSQGAAPTTKGAKR